jgi:DNA-directed RNA polymerase subunit RPC12/RpoP
MAKMRCTSCGQEILEDDPIECPYCYSKNLVPTNSSSLDNMAEDEAITPDVRSPGQRLKAMIHFTTGVGIILFVLGMAILFWDVTLYGNKYGPGLLKPDFGTWAFLCALGIIVSLLGFALVNKKED